MKKAFQISLRIFKYLFVTFCVIYWIGVVIDDWGLIEKYWSSHWPEYLGIWAVWFLIYSLGFSLYYWGGAIVVIFINHKIIKPLNEK